MINLNEFYETKDLVQEYGYMPMYKAVVNIDNETHQVQIIENGTYAGLFLVEDTVIIDRDGTPIQTTHNYEISVRSSNKDIVAEYMHYSQLVGNLENSVNIIRIADQATTYKAKTTVKGKVTENDRRVKDDLDVFECILKYAENSLGRILQLYPISIYGLEDYEVLLDDGDERGYTKLSLRYFDDNEKKVVVANDK